MALVYNALQHSGVIEYKLAFKKLF